MDLSRFYAAYRADGHGRPAYEPSMSSGGGAAALRVRAQGPVFAGDRARVLGGCAYRAIAANRVPDHSTIAEFRKRHEAAL
jgi:hypothetical protein